MTVVLVPVSRDQLAGLREGALSGPLAGFAATAALRDTFGLAVADDEETDRTALLLAGLSSLMSYGNRLVVVVEAPVVDTGDPLGGVAVSGISWKDVSAFFADAPEAAQQAAATARHVAGSDLDAAWDDEDAQRLMTEHDLLWYGPEEVGTIVGV